MNSTKQDRLLSTKQVQEYLQASRVSIWRWEKEGKFPKHVKIGRTTRWRESEVLQWIASLQTV